MQKITYYFQALFIEDDCNSQFDGHRSFLNKAGLNNF